MRGSTASALKEKTKKVDLPKYGGDDGDGLVGLQDGQVALHADGDDLDVDLVVVGHVLDEAGQQQVELDRGLEGGLQADFHHARRRVKNLARL